jgi:hypothetical protein
MKLKTTTTALIVALLMVLVRPASDARAQYFTEEEQLAKVVEIKVAVADHVKDGCLPRPGILKSEAELILRRSGFQVDDDAVRDTLLLAPLGSEIPSTGNCVVALEINMVRYELLSDESYGLVLSFARTSLHWGPKAGLQEQLRNAVNQLVTELANEIFKARANASSKTQ